MRSKKLLLALLSVLMMATAGVACGGNPGQTSSSSSESSSSESSSSVQEEVTIALKLDKTEATMHLFEVLSLKAKVKGTTEAVEWTSSNPSVATVSDGVVIPVTTGTVTITASVGGEEASCAITITEHQGDIELIVPYKTLELQISEQGQESKNVSVSGCLGLLNDIAGGAFVYSVEDESIVTVDQETGVATPVSVGSTTITISGTFKGVSAKDAITVPVVVTSVETHELSTAVTFRENREDAISIDLSEYNITGLTAFEMNGKTYEANLGSDKRLTVSKSQFKDFEGGEKSIAISGITDTGKIFIKGKVNYINYAIQTADDFIAFQKLYVSENTTTYNRSNIYTYVVLENNIDLANNNFNYGVKACNFYGVFDGQGYTLDEFRVTSNSMFFKIGRTDLEKVTVFKNVAFTNGTRNVGNAGGVIAYILENAIMDNVYVQCDQEGNATSNDALGFSSAIAYWTRSNNSSKKVEIKNCFAQIESPDVKPMTGALVSAVEESCTTIENCYAVSGNAVGLYGVINNGDWSYDAVIKKANKDNFYSTLTRFSADVKAVPLGFDIDVWKMSGDMLVFKNSATDWDIVELSGKKLFANNRANSLELDLTEYNVQDGRVLKVSVGTKPIEISNCSFANGKLTIPGTSIEARGDVDVSVTIKTSTGRLTANAQACIVDYAIDNEQEFADFQNTYATTDGRTGVYTYVILTNNIDLAGESFEYLTEDTDGDGKKEFRGSKFYGVFDGQGYTLNNLNVKTNSLFYQIGDANYDKVSVFKNVAFTNATREVGLTAEPEVGGLLAFYVENVLMENLYIQGNQLGDIPGKNNTGYMGAIADYAHNLGVEGKTVTIKNCFVEYESEGHLKMAGALVARAQKGVVTVENSYAISNTAVGLYGVYEDDQGYASITKLANKTNLYTSVDAFKSVITSVPAGFNSYWAMKDGVLVFKSSPATARIAEEQVVANNRNDALVLDLSAYNVTNVTKVMIGGNVFTDYTYADNTLTVAFDKLPKGKFAISVATTTATDDLLVKAQAYVVDYAIGTVTELEAFRDACVGKTTADPYMYVALTANIDYASGEYYGEGTATGTFFGSFDGRGYTVSNVKVKNSFFPSIKGIYNGQRSVIKNFGLVNVIKHTGNGGALLANDILDTDVDNVYVKGTVEVYTNTLTGAIGGTVYRVNFTNSVVEIDYKNNTQAPALFGNVVNENGTTSVDNIYTLMTGSESYTYNLGGSLHITNHNMKYTVENFTNAIKMTRVPAGFDVGYWGIENGVLTFKNV